MTYRELQDYVLGYGFKPGQRAAAQVCINFQWARIWSEHDWTFKQVGPTDLAVSAGEAEPTMPVDFSDVIVLQNENGDRLTPLAPDAFDRLYEPLVRDGQSGSPEAFKVINYQAVLGPVPDTSVIFTLSYLRRVGYHPLGDTSQFTVGSMVSDSDLPAFLPVEHHPWIGIRAARQLMRQTGDPTWRDLQPEIDETETLALNELLPSRAPEGNLQFGRDMWGL